MDLNTITQPTLNDDNAEAPQDITDMVARSEHVMNVAHASVFGT